MQPEFIGGLNSSGSQARAAVDELRRSKVPVGSVFERATAGVSQQAKAATVDSLQPGSAELNRQASLLELAAITGLVFCVAQSLGADFWEWLLRLKFDESLAGDDRSIEILRPLKSLIPTVVLWICMLA
ncbi:MAG: hypothetical protein ACKON9_01450, partial [Planctomycetaceae bacterium]